MIDVSWRQGSPVHSILSNVAVVTTVTGEVDRVWDVAAQSRSPAWGLAGPRAGHYRSVWVVAEAKKQGRIERSGPVVSLGVREAYWAPVCQMPRPWSAAKSWVEPGSSRSWYTGTLGRPTSMRSH